MFLKANYRPGIAELHRLRILLVLVTWISCRAIAQDDDEFFDFEEDELLFEESGRPEALVMPDPLEPMNRVVFRFNDKAYRYFLKPVAKGFRVVPKPVRASVSNFYNNIRTPMSSISALLRFDTQAATTEIGRFMVNSTIGVLGLFDPASSMGLEKTDNDLGQVLAFYGVGPGIYVVVPFFGSYSLRHGFGDLATIPISPVMNYWDPSFAEWALYRTVEAEVKLSLDADNYETFYDQALDPYIFFRNAYMQNRAGIVNKAGKIEF